MVYFVQYKLDHDRHTKYYYKFEAPDNLSWRELQEYFDPDYRYNSLEFYRAGEPIES